MLRTIFFLAILVPGFFAALRSRYAALVMYLWFALFRPQDWVWIDITQWRLSLLLGVILLVPSVVTGLIPNITHPLSIGMLLFLGSSVLSQTGAVDPALGWMWVDYLLRLILASLMLVTLVSSPRRLVGVIAVISGSLGFHAAKAGLAFVVGGGMRFGDGLAGAFVDNNGYALGTVMILPLLLATAQNVPLLVPTPGPLQTWVRRAFYLSVPLCILAVIGTYSRGGFLALAAALLMFLMLQRRRFTALAGVLTVFTILLVVVPIPQSYIDRLQTIRTYDKTDTEDAEGARESAQSRPHFWRVGINMGMSRAFGVGLRQYEAAYDRYDFLYGRFGSHRAVHNAHVQVFAELGFLGAAIWSGLFGWAFVSCLRIRARSRESHLTPEDRHLLFTIANALIVSMTAFVIGGSFLALALNDITWLTFAIVAATDRVSVAMCAHAAVEPVRPAVPATPRPPQGRLVAEVPLAFRAIDTFATSNRMGKR